MKPENIRQKLFLTNPSAELVEAFDRTLETGVPLKTNECPVLDASGNPLIKGGLYQFGDKTLKVRKWEFGAGNMLDKYYRVFYTDNNLRDTFLVVNARYPNGVFANPLYQSRLIKL
jgi:hypothetical protein